MDTHLNRTRLATLAALAALGLAHAGGTDTTPVPVANPKSAGASAPDTLTSKLIGLRVTESLAAQGSMPVENPTATAGGAIVSHYGYLDDGPQVAPPNQVTPPGGVYEATKTEPDKNTYLVLQGQRGPDASYDYGTHFLFQGHENGKAGATGPKCAAITRVNLDADAAHRVTVLASQDTDGNFIPVIDGSTWDPFSGRLLFSVEMGPPDGGLWQATPDYPSTVQNLATIFGHGGYEGVQLDSAGNVWVVEDVGGPAGAVNKQAKQPNSFVYRFVPTSAADLTLGGRMQVLQVDSLSNPGTTINFHAGQADADILSQDVHDLHTYGLVFNTRWVTIHDTAVDGFTAFDANALAKSHNGTPFKRPENGMFRPRSGFTDFFFTETGDTNALTQAGADFGGFGGLLRLRQSSPSATTGTLSLFYKGDVAHTGLDNLAFLTTTKLLSVEDAGDTLHSQRNALDSMFMFDTLADYSDPSLQPVRVLAEGRDPSATFDSAAGSAGLVGFPNEGDNEITGVHVSDGDASVAGLLGTVIPRPFGGKWRVFWTQQHGDNMTWEIIKAPNIVN